MPNDKVTRYKKVDFKKPKKVPRSHRDITPRVITEVSGKIKTKKVKEGSKRDARLAKRGYTKTPFGKNQQSLTDGASADFPEIKKGNEGKFTKWVEKNMPGVDTCKAASKIMRSRTKKYSPAVVKMANYANNFGCKTKKEDGASVPLKGKQKNLPEHLKKKILASDGASYGNLGPSEPGKTISAKKFERKAKRNKKKITNTASSSTNSKGYTSSNKKTVVNKKNKRFVKGEMSMIDKDRGVGATAVEYYKQKKGKHY